MYVFLIEVENILSPICIYSKNKKESLTTKELTKHLVSAKAELIKRLDE